MDPRSLNAGDTHLLFDLQGQDLAEELVQAEVDPDSPHDNLMSVEGIDWPSWPLQLHHDALLGQWLAIPRFLLATPALPWPYLGVLQRPPSSSQ